MRIGYARVSTFDQNTDLQTDALATANCERVYTDKVTGSRTKRPQLDELLGQLRRGDTIVVWRLDRLGRSLHHLVTLADDLDRKGVHLESLTESISTAGAAGRLVFHIFGALAEFERSLISERSKAGLAAARKRKRFAGRRSAFDDPEFVEHAKALLSDPNLSKAAAARQLGISAPTLYRWFPGGDPSKFGTGEAGRRLEGRYED